MRRGDGILPEIASRDQLTNRRTVKAALPVIEIAGLRVERDAVILDGIDWTVRRGENWVILGANGSGKTSLLSTITGYMPLTGGTIAVLGETYGHTDWRDLRKRIGIVSSSVHQMMAGHENTLETIISGRHAMIGMWGKIEATERKRAERILRQIEAEPISQRPWRVLSQGERQRVLIGRALMAKPELLILDEPCAGLDPVAREHFLQFVERLAHRRSAPTLVLVTHHVEEIMPAFSHLLVLKAGRVLSAGPKPEVLRSAVLSNAFHAPIMLRRKGERYSLSAESNANRVL